MTHDPRPYLPSCMLYPQPMYSAWGGAPAQNFVRTCLCKKKTLGNRSVLGQLFVHGLPTVFMGHIWVTALLVYP